MRAGHDRSQGLQGWSCRSSLQTQAHGMQELITARIRQCDRTYHAENLLF